MDHKRDEQPNKDAGIGLSLPFGVFYHPFMTPKSPRVSASKNLENGFCIIKQIDRPLAELLRFTLSPEKVLTLDLEGKLPGEFVYITADLESLKRAERRNAFTTAFRERVELPQNFTDHIANLLLKKSLEILSLAQKAGILIQGFAKCEEILPQNKNYFYLYASDAAIGSTKKLIKYAQHSSNALNNAEISKALGLENAMHVLIKPHALTENLKILLTKYSNLKDRTKEND